MPGGFAGVHVYGDEGCGEFVFEVGAIAAPIVDGGAAEGQVDQAKRIIARCGGPHVGRTAGEGFAFGREFGDVGARHVPGPQHLAGDGIKTMDDTRWGIEFLAIQHLLADLALLAWMGPTDGRAAVFTMPEGATIDSLLLDLLLGVLDTAGFIRPVSLTELSDQVPRAGADAYELWPDAATAMARRAADRSLAESTVAAYSALLGGPHPAAAELGDLLEITAALASVAIAWQKETGADPARANVDGGPIALGHPLGATGARLMTTLLHELERSGGRYGLQTMCEGGGQANVTIIERL